VADTEGKATARFVDLARPRAAGAAGLSLAGATEPAVSNRAGCGATATRACHPSLPTCCCTGLSATLRSCANLDNAPDQRFDKLIALAAQVCGTPMPAMALVDAYRQWFKASGWLGTLLQIPRAWTFTSAAVEADAPLVFTEFRARLTDDNAGFRTTLASNSWAE
jgi:hypothetical protein